MYRHDDDEDYVEDDRAAWRAARQLHQYLPEEDGRSLRQFHYDLCNQWEKATSNPNDDDHDRSMDDPDVEGSAGTA